MNKSLIRSALCSLALGTALSSSAISVSYDTFGQTDDTFGGSGIPNNAVATTTIQDGAATINLGLTAHQRYDNPALINDGAGTFTANAGSNAKGPNNIVGALWNFAWDIDVSGALPASYQFTLLYDFNPAAGTSESAHGSINLSHLLYGSLDGSENLLFSFLDGTTPNGALAQAVGLTAPPSGSFDPNVNGEYTFALIASQGGNELGRSAIRVNVVGGTSASVPDGGATAILLGLGFAGLFAFRKARA